MSTLITIRLEKCEFKDQIWTLTLPKNIMKTELREEYFNVVEESVLLRAKTQRCSQFQISVSETGLPAG